MTSACSDGDSRDQSAAVVERAGAVVELGAQLG